LKCDYCQRGAHVHCATWRNSRIDPGGMAEWIRLPGDIVKNDAFSVEDLKPQQAIFIEPLGCCLKALNRIPDGIEEATGIVVGCGVMGMLNLMAARALGAERLLAVEPVAERRRLATQIGADAALPPEEAATEWKQLADFVVIGPGHPEVIRQALDYVRPGGTALLFTPTATGVTTTLNLGELYFREVSLIPSYSCGPEDTGAAYNLLAEGEVNPMLLITHRFRLNQVQQAYDTAKRGASALKVVVTLAEKIDA
jgi:L-iditol 2-dehydrogenase